MMKVSSARMPCWNDLAHTTLNLYVTFEETKESLGEIIFTASPNDPELHGRELFERAVALEFGNIAEPGGEMIKTNVLLQRAELTAVANSVIEKLQADVNILQDSVELEIATDKETAALATKKTSLSAWKKYRVLLSRVQEQEGFPTVVQWPEAPGE
ncbi:MULTISPECIES: tail fiber assembly protein [Pseudomonas]|uniref:tail fiber assembly protein n=1 Tax=Pseudomonas TaxID=286 RepID=UPI0005BEB5A3|nr:MULTISPECIES: tail fiber assembly protein [Pseudomonas]AJO76916.1 tail protein [Pseudomonas sp. MRSN 12121]